MSSGSEFSKYINPLLTALRGLGGSAKPAEAKAAVADLLNLSDSVLEEKMASGSSRFDSHVGWARYYLVRSGHIDSSRRGVWALTESGRHTDALSEDEIKTLVKKVIADWGRRSRGSAEPDAGQLENPPPDAAPDDHRTRLYAILQGLPAPGFERLCQRLLREADFEQVTVTGRSGDGGIDGIGIVEVNAFVSFKVLFQCKRYVGSVGPSTVRDFRGAMMGRADKGIILSTGTLKVCDS